MAQQADDPRWVEVRPWRVYGTVFLYALFAFTPFLGHHGGLLGHEVFVAQPARQMVRGDAWVLQPFADTFRTEKPPGMSWLVSISFLLTGHQNTYTARLPSVLCAALYALVVAHLAWRVAGPRVALFAGLIAATCYGIQQRATLAETDIALTLAAACAHGVAFWLVMDAKRSLTVASTAFWMCMVAGILLKGPIILVFTVVPLIVAVAWSLRDQRAVAVRVVYMLVHPVAIGLAGTVVGLWIWRVHAVYPQAFEQWRYEMSRVGGSIRNDPWWFYFTAIPAALLPWVLLLPYGCRAARSSLGDLRVRVLVSWFGVSLILLTTSAFKAMHYALPMLAPAIVFCGMGLRHLLSRGEPDARATLVRGRATYMAFAVVLIGFVLIRGLHAPGRTDASPLVAFGQAVEATVPEGEAIYLVGVGEEQACWFIHRNYRQMTTPETDRLEQQARAADTDAERERLHRLSLAGQIDHLAAVARGRVWVLCRGDQVDAVSPYFPLSIVAESIPVGRSNRHSVRALVAVTVPEPAG